jgi:ribonuclease Z
VHECNFPDSKRDWAERTGHSHTTQVAVLARHARVGRLVLVHVDPKLTQPDPIGLETARSIFPETVLAEDLMEVDF